MKFARHLFNVAAALSTLLFLTALMCRVEPHHFLIHDGFDATFPEDTQYVLLWDRREIILAYKRTLNATPGPLTYRGWQLDPPHAVFPVTTWGWPWPRIESATVDYAGDSSLEWIAGVRLGFAVTMTAILPASWLILRAGKKKYTPRHPSP
jgi:hypothetical protein